MYPRQRTLAIIGGILAAVLVLGCIFTGTAARMWNAAFNNSSATPVSARTNNGTIPTLPDNCVSANGNPICTLVEGKWVPAGAQNNGTTTNGTQQNGSAQGFTGENNGFNTNVPPAPQHCYDLQGKPTCTFNETMQIWTPSAPPAQGDPNPGQSENITAMSGTELPANCISWQAFETLKPATTTSEWPYDFIGVLDQQSQKQNHPKGGYTLTSSSEHTYVVWTGSYGVDETYAGNVARYSVDGLTGVWVQKPNTTVTWQTPGGSLCVTGYTAGGQQNATFGNGESAYTSCAPKAQVVEAINANKQNGAFLFTKIDEVASANLAATNRGLEHVNIVPAGKPAARLVWLRSGNIEGGMPMKLHEADGMTLYLLADGEQATVTTSHPYRMITLCEGLNPEQDFSSWWGR